MVEAEKFFETLKGYLDVALRPLTDRIKAAEERPMPARGEKGDPGQDGAPGGDGAPGKDGADGAPGRDGVDGKEGPAGRDGERGEKGEQGERGETGIAGDAGRDGKDGEKGADGERGQPGERGADGAKGDPGEKGDRGDPGPEGQRGADGVNGKDGAPGLDGTPGLKGDVGEAGPAGKDGADGRDALQIEVLESIDPAKSYPRGTFAACRGGTVRTFRKSDPLPADGDLERAGWHVVMCGVQEIALELSADGRTMGIAMRTTDGAIVTKSAKVPQMLYRGIWEARSYDAGDVVTRNGCSWVAKRDTHAGEMPDDSSGTEAWQMSVKKGRDGRDGLRGERGAPGRDGKEVGP
jgi:hypothetical protein